MRKIIVCLLIGMCTATVCKTQILKPNDSVVVFYIVTKNNSGAINAVFEGCSSKKINVERVAPEDPGILQYNFPRILIFKVSGNFGSEEEIEKIKSKLSSVAGVLNVRIS